MIPNVLVFLTVLVSTVVFAILLLTHDPVFVHDPDLRNSWSTPISVSDQRDTYFVKRLGRRIGYLALVILGVLCLFSIPVFR
jgi:hypothetical protein